VRIVQLSCNSAGGSHNNFGVVVIFGLRLVLEGDKQ